MVDLVLGIHLMKDVLSHHLQSGKDGRVELSQLEMEGYLNGKITLLHMKYIDTIILFDLRQPNSAFLIGRKEIF